MYSAATTKQETGSDSEELRLRPTHDRKTACYPGQKNTFGLMHGLPPVGTCPGCTTSKGGCAYVAPGRKTSTCYVDKLARAYPSVWKNLAWNTRLLTGAASMTEMSKIIDREFDRFMTHETSNPAVDKVDALKYRLHWAGDVFSPEYAEALSWSMATHPDIQFWGYTRTFDRRVIEHLIGSENMVLYLSLDPVNIAAGISTYNDLCGDARPRLKLCYMHEINDLADRVKALRDDEELRTGEKYPWMSDVNVISCPVDTGAMELEGACVKCNQCLTWSKDRKSAVWFKS